ncbi:MAG: 1-acyl-sn-glycerol-3-phosphate acyltransferase [Clostridiales bacterium]|nr:1-acyl-sn-glycerol-3-phosphate acyltransferase [Clostridiales bacterium]
MLSKERIEVLNRIIEYESKGLWDKDVETDPKSKELLPNKVDYLGKKLSSKIQTFIANKLAINYYESLIKKGDFIIKEIRGIENFSSIKGGAIITCNHFSILDNYAVYRAIKPYLEKGRQLYKIIREGNYTSFGGLYGYLFRHCNTLPLSSNIKTMQKFLASVKVLLSRGEKILIYPEQAMWWNYKKPRPLRPGAFNIAVKNSVPVIPLFITMTDGEKVLDDGSKVQEYYLNFLPPIYKKEGLGDKENQAYMSSENFNAWKGVYEKFYGKKLTYKE